MLDASSLPAPPVSSYAVGSSPCPYQSPSLAHFVDVMEQGRVVLEGPSAEVTASEHVQTAYLGGR
jgi:hypothetical protein